MLFRFMSEIDKWASKKLNWEALQLEQTWTLQNVKYVTQNPF
jgi:hypothetical protein